MKRTSKPKPSTVRFRQLRQRRLIELQRIRENKDWILWAAKFYWAERGLSPDTFVPLSSVRASLLSEKDFSSADFFKTDEDLLRALGQSVRQ
jgi:hypothetical protein